jgi:hypothetical protein
LAVEFEAYPEAKLLKPINLRWLFDKYGLAITVARAIGVSESFVRQKSKQKK